MIDRDLLNLLPPLRRARGDRLYASDQRHWVDLWKQGGTWLLGRRPDGAGTEWKNQLDKGLTGWAPSLWPRRLEPLVQRLIPQARHVRIVRNEDRVPEIPLWRPWHGEVEETPSPVMRLVLPSGPCQAVVVIYTERWEGVVPDHDITSPADAAALVKSVGQLLRFTHDPNATAERGAMAEAFDRHSGRFGTFHRKGIWLWPAVSKEQYSSLFRALFGAGFFLNPDPLLPSILPSTLSQGEWGRWSQAVNSWKEN